MFEVHKDESCAIQQDPIGPFQRLGAKQPRSWIYMYCIAESTVYAYTDRPYLVIPVYMPCSRGPDKVEPPNQYKSISSTDTQQSNVMIVDSKCCG